MDMLTLPEMVGFIVALLTSPKVVHKLYKVSRFEFLQKPEIGIINFIKGLELREILLGGKVVTFLASQRENLAYKRKKGSGPKA